MHRRSIQLIQVVNRSGRFHIFASSLSRSKLCVLHKTEMMSEVFDD